MYIKWKLIIIKTKHDRLILLETLIALFYIISFSVIVFSGIQVPECIDTLAQAGIGLWVLTGDKIETAINIGYCRKFWCTDYICYFS